MRTLHILAATAMLAAGAVAQATPLQLNAGFGGTFFSTATDTTCYFDLTVLDPNGITLFSIDHNLNQGAGGRNTADIRVASGAGITFLNNETNVAFWPAGADASSDLVSLGLFTPTPGTIAGGLFLPAGDHAIAITYENGLPIFSPNPGTNGAVANNELAFSGGSVSPGFLAAPFNGAGVFIFNGSFDYYSGNVPVASAVRFGESCPTFADAATVIEQFDAATGNPADLTGQQITFQPNGAGGYIVSGLATGSGYVAPGPMATVLPLGDDTLSGPITLMNTVTGPDGNPVNTVEVESNGRVLFSATGNMPSVGGPFPFDFVNSAANVQIGADYNASIGGLVTVEEIGTDVVFTWDSVPEFGQPSTFTTQIVLDSLTGAITFRFDNYFPVFTANVGISQGAPFAAFADVLIATDLSATISTPVDTGTSSVGIAANPLTTPVLGSSLVIGITQVPQSSLGESLLIGFSNPGIDLTNLGAPGCVLRSQGASTLSISGASLVSTNIPNRLGLQGLTLYIQAASLDPQANPLFLSLSNGIEAVLQRQ